MLDRKKIALVHIAKAKTGMTEEEYRDLLGSLNAASSKDLTPKTFKQIMKRFKALGFVSRSRQAQRRVQNLPPEKQTIMKKLEAILKAMDLPWSYADGIAQKRFGVDTVQWLTPKDLMRVLQMMIYHQKRRDK